MPLCLKVQDWPPLDQELWTAARTRAGFLSGSSPAHKWSSRRCRIVEQAYGQWLSWLVRNPGLDIAQTPEGRVSRPRMEAFVLELQSRVAPASVAMMIGAIKRMFDVLAPKADLDWLKYLSTDLKVEAKSSRNRMAHMTSPEQLFDLGLRLLKEARLEDDCGGFHAAIKSRDGLAIAMLVCCPVRIANFHQIELGQHLLFDGARFWLKFDGGDTKTGVGYEGEFPVELTEWIDTYLRVYRPKLLARATASAPTSRLWIGRDGHHLGEAAIRAQIKERSKVAFARHVWPHLFRAIAVTGLVDHAPDHFAVAPDLLGHSNDRTTRKHYMLSRGMQAHKTVQDALQRERADALARQKLARRKQVVRLKSGAVGRGRIC